MTNTEKQLCESVILSGQRATSRPWKHRGGYEYLIGGDLHSVHTRNQTEDAAYIVLAANNAEKLARALLVMEEALGLIAKRDLSAADTPLYRQEIAEQALGRANEILGEQK